MKEKIRRVLDASQELVEQMAQLREQMARRAGATRATWRVLAAAAGQARTVPQLARRLGVKRQSVQRIADQLVESGRARYVTNPDHRRSPLLKLTAPGEAALKVLERELTDWESDLGAEHELELEELETALYVLRAVRALIRV
jgi:DNA-binding MarR family transcriptional regulator